MQISKLLNFKVFILGVVFGTLLELILTRADIYRFANPSFCGIPYWVPFAWGLGAMLFVSFIKKFKFDN